MKTTEENTKLEHKDTWKFIYKKILCEIVHWGVGYMNNGEGIWNSYIYIFKDNFPDSFEKMLAKKSRKGTFGYYWKIYDLEEMFNFDGGISFYKIIRDEFNNKKIGIKVGNDYAHSWNEGKHYDQEIIAKNLKETVDHLLESITDDLGIIKHDK